MPQYDEKYESRHTFTEALGLVYGAIRSWLPPAVEIKRMAVGGSIVLPRENIADSVSFINEHAEGVSVPSGATDLTFRVNRPRPSSFAPHLVINRLSTWSTVAFVRSHLKLKVSTGGLIAPPSINSRFGCQFEFDVNTPARFEGTFSPDELVGLVDELKVYAEELATENVGHE